MIKEAINFLNEAIKLHENHISGKEPTSEESQEKLMQLIVNARDSLGDDMPKGKAIKSAKQFRFMEGVAHGMVPNKGMGPSPEVAKKMLRETSHKKKSNFAKAYKKAS